MSALAPTPALACVPAAIPATERKAHFELARDLFTRRSIERATLPDGYAFRFDSSEFEAVARFVVNERKCCPFLRFEVQLAAQSGPLWLRLTGPAGTREILDAELNLASSCGCSCGSSTAGNNKLVRWTTAGGLFAALGVCAACCLLPFVLISLGVAGAWVGTLDSLSRYKWPFIALAAVLLGYGFYVVYWRPKRQCAAGGDCTTRATGRSVRVGLWIATVLVIGGIVFEQIEPLLVAAR